MDNYQLNFIQNENQIKNLKKSKTATECSSCKQRNWIETANSSICPSCEHFNSEPKHQIDEKIFRQDKKFSTRLLHPDK